MPASNFSKIKIMVEGWRNISHSYALVNQFQLMHWRKSGTANIIHTDMPFIMQHWSTGGNSAGFNENDHELIREISEPIVPNSIYRIFAPFDLDTQVKLPTVTYAVTEFGLDSENYDQKQVDRYAILGGQIHTPSEWSKFRLMASGMPEEIINVIPHAADSSYFFQIDNNSNEMNRQSLGYTNEDVILLNVGTHHWNKGLDLVVTSFAKARKNNKNLKLILKDQRSTYLMNSESFVHQTLNNLGINDDETLNSIKLISGHLNLAQLNSLYNLADLYLTPYRAEGFNLPALEAQTCGTPVLATLGGATDDFLNKNSNYFVTGKYIENSYLKEDLKINAYIEPNISEIIEILEKSNPKNHTSFTTPQFSWLDACNNIISLLQK
jgi:glycosyltransferase involved in cell wall biosynthesis